MVTNSSPVTPPSVLTSKMTRVAALSSSTDSRVEAAGHAGHDFPGPTRRHGFPAKSTNRRCIWLVAIAVGRYPSLTQRANQRRWRFVGGDPRFGIAQVLLGGIAGIEAARTGLWVLAVAFALYVVSIFWGELLWKRSQLSRKNTSRGGLLATCLYARSSLGRQAGLANGRP